MGKVIGVLGLQGAYDKHIKMLEGLECEPKLVRYPEELDNSDGLIFPGGESSTMSKLIDQMNLRDRLLEYDKPILATCAGLILLSQTGGMEQVKTLNRLPLTCQRNAYGRQIESFIAEIELPWNHEKFEAVFIRAPIIDEIKSKDLKVLIKYNGSPVLIQYKNILATSFHPELTKNTAIHKKFVNMI